MIKEPLFYLPLNTLPDKHATNPMVPVLSKGKWKNSKIESYDATKLAIEHSSVVGSYVEFKEKGPDIYIVTEGDIDLKSSFTLSCWLKPTAVEGHNVLFGSSIARPENMSLYCFITTKDDGKTFFNIATILAAGAQGFILDKNKMQHIALVYDSDDQTTSFFLNGVKQQPDKEYQRPPNFGKVKNFRIGAGFYKDSEQEKGEYQGGLAHLRWYDQALSQSEIQEVMLADQQGAKQAVRPLEMKLYTIDQDEYLPVLFIERPGRENTLELQIGNPTAKAYTFQKEKPTGHNVQLAFRKKVISDHWMKNFSGNLLVGEGWMLTKVDQKKEEDVLSFRSTERLILGPGSSTTLTIPNFSVAAMGGARNTRVQIRAKLAEFNSPITIMRHMEIQSHQGQKNIPLVARILGSNSLLNTGVDNTMTIQISNMNEIGGVKLRGAADQTASKLTLRIPGAIVKDENTIQAALNDNLKDNFQVESAKRTPDGDYVITTFTVKADKEVTISREQPLEIKLSGWECPVGKLGYYSLELAYEDIPSYWDGGWQLPVELSPLSFGTAGDGLQIGKAAIGTDLTTKSPEKLHIEGNTLINGQLLIGDPTKMEAAKAAFKIHIDTNDPKPANDHAILFAGDYGEHDSAWIRFHSRKNQAHNLEIQVDKKGSDHLVLNPYGGNVGVGTNDPQATLHVVRPKEEIGNVVVIFESLSDSESSLVLSHKDKKKRDKKIKIQNSEGSLCFYPWDVKSGESNEQADYCSPPTLTLHSGMFTGATLVGDLIMRRGTLKRNVNEPLFVRGKISIPTGAINKNGYPIPKVKLNGEIYLIIEETITGKSHSQEVNISMIKTTDGGYHEIFTTFDQENKQYKVQFLSHNHNSADVGSISSDITLNYYAIHRSLFADVSTPKQTTS